MQQYAFKKKLKNHLNGDINLFLDFILETDTVDWVYDSEEEEMEFVVLPFRQTRCVFFYYNETSCLVIREGKRETYIGTCRSVRGSLSVSSLFSDVEREKAMETLFHLEEIYEELYHEYKKKKKTQKKEKKILMKEKGKQLQALLADITLPFKEKSSPPFLVVLKENKKTKHLAFMYEDDMYVEAFLHIKTGTIKINYFKRKKDIVRLFKQEKNHILKCIYTLFTIEETPKPKEAKETNAVNEKIDTLLERVEHLKMLKSWIDNSLIHQLTYTIPGDLHKLKEGYNGVNRTRLIEEEVNISLTYIEKKLEVIADQIEKNRQHYIRQTIEVIKRR